MRSSSWTAQPVLSALFLRAGGGSRSVSGRQPACGLDKALRRRPVHHYCFRCRPACRARMGSRSLLESRHRLVRRRPRGRALRHHLRRLDGRIPPALHAPQFSIGALVEDCAATSDRRRGRLAPRLGGAAPPSSRVYGQDRRSPFAGHRGGDAPEWSARSCACPYRKKQQSGADAAPVSGTARGRRSRAGLRARPALDSAHPGDPVPRRLGRYPVDRRCAAGAVVGRRGPCRAGAPHDLGGEFARPHVRPSAL